MEINFRRLGIALVLAGIGGLFFVPRALVAQVEGKDQETKGRVVLSKLFAPIYPPLARQALVFGDVHLRISVLANGSIASITPIDGHPLLVQAALESAKRSQFVCEDCGDSDPVERTFTYSFQPSSDPKPVDSSCCLEEHVPPEKATMEVSQSDDRVTVTTPAECLCSIEYLGRLFDRRMRLIAGRDASDCGRVRLNADPKASLKCARHAISTKRAFFVRFDSAGMDSFLSDGFAGDGSGKVFNVEFDSLGIGPSPGLEILDNGHDAVRICPKPVHVRPRIAPKGTFWGYSCAPRS